MCMSVRQVTTNPDTGKLWGPECPLTTTRDDVRSVDNANAIALPTFEACS